MIQMILRLMMAACFMMAGVAGFAQDTISLMTYNLLKFSASSADRVSYFQETMKFTSPDILVAQEVFSLDGAQFFHNNVLDSSYSMGTFSDGYDTDHVLFFKKTKFNFLETKSISTALRDINRFGLVHKTSGDTLYVYSVHLKAGSGSSNAAKRADEVKLLLNDLNTINSPNFVVLGDFNIYSSNEAAYQQLIATNRARYFVDPFTLSGTWNNSNYSAYHTQSTRSRQFGGGAHGGLDDRFDMILFSPALTTFNDVHYLPNSTQVIGNGGSHYNDSINHQPNATVPLEVANALHYASDHLPVMAKIVFEDQTTSLSAPSSNPPTGYRVYPNPFTNQLNVGGLEERCEISILSLSAGVFYNQIVETSMIQIDTQDIPAGVYVLRVVAGNTVWQQSFIKI